MVMATIRSVEAFAHAGLWQKVLGLLTEMPRLALRPSADAVQVGMGGTHPAHSHHRSGSQLLDVSSCF